MKRPVAALLHSLIFISFVLSACAGASGPEAAQTAAAATLDAQVAAAQGDLALQTAEAENAALQATVDALAAANSALQAEGTQTAVAQSTLSAIAPQVIPPDGVACRTGPNPGFAKVGDLAAGVPVDAFGRSSDGEWWQVASPKNDGTTCWVFWEDDFTFLGEVFNLPMVAGPSLPTATFAPTHTPGIAARYVTNLTCNGVRMAIVRVINLGPETYQSAIVKVSDSSGTELHRSDGNNEFLPNDTTCPGGQPTLGPGEEKFVAVSIQGAVSGDTLTIRVTVCTEKGTGGNCWSSSTQFVN